MKYYNILTIIFIIFLSVNIYSYNIERIDTSVTLRDNGIVQVSDKLILTEVNKSDIITFLIFPVYDLKIKSDYKDLTYSYSLDTLTVNASDCCILNNSLNLEIIYLTDVYSYKQGNVWSVIYYPLFKEYTDTLKFTFPKNTEIIDLSVDLQNISIVNNQFVLTLNNPVSSLDINYSLNHVVLPESNNFNYLTYIISILLGLTLLFSGIYIILRKKKSVKVIKESKEDLLLGLNENEQKIIKIILENDGILQKSLSKECFLPKGTVSRNLKKLESKGYIEIKRYGINKKVFSGKVFSKK